MVDLGQKFECDECGVKVYDLGRPQALCPRCGRDLKSEGDSKPAETTRRAPRAAESETPAPAADENVESGDDDLVIDGDDSDDVEEELEDFDEEFDDDEEEEEEEDDDTDD